MNTAREEVLARVRGAVGASPQPVAIPRSYRREGEHAPGDPALVAQLVNRLEDYRAEVVEVGTGSGGSTDLAIGRAVTTALAARSIVDVVTPAGTPPEWTAELDAVVDGGSLEPLELDLIPAVVTGAVVAIVQTGTIVLDASALCGRRALTLVPDVHVCVLEAEAIVETVPEALRRVDPSRPLTFISGPSATSDIELTRVEGVHGPRTLVVVIAHRS